MEEEVQTSNEPVINNGNISSSTADTETITPNLGLIKPGFNDNFDISKINQNMDILDGTIKSIQDTIDALNGTLQTIQSALQTMRTDITSNTSSIGTLNTKTTDLTTRMGDAETDIETLEDNSLTFVKTGEF